MFLKIAVTQAMLLGGQVTVNQHSVAEYIRRQGERYAEADRTEKTRILDEVVAVTGYHRKSVVRRLSGRRRPARGGGVGRPVQYGGKVAAAASLVHEAAGRIGARRLHPFVGELAARLVQLGELVPEPETMDLLNRASPATLERLLSSQQPSVRRKPRGLTKRGTALRYRIPVRTFRDWDDARPGFVEVDTVAHCGPTSAGFHLWTVMAVDVATGWVEMAVVWGKTQDRVGAALRRMQRMLPVPLLGIDCDNGSEFINRGLYAYCQDQGITLTRSRPYRKNDAAHVEQKNGAVIRRVTGHERYSSSAAFQQLRSLYSLLRLQANYFQPVRLLTHQQRHGTRIRRRHDSGQTPYQRMVASGLLTGGRKAAQERLYRSLNPLWLSRRIEAETEALLRLAWRTGEPLNWSPPGNRNFEV